MNLVTAYALAVLNSAEELDDINAAAVQGWLALGDVLREKGLMRRWGRTAGCIRHDGHQVGVTVAPERLACNCTR